jgi:DNA-binding XRE family transcriptional regulator
MKKFLFYFAVTGWLIALIVHLLTLADFDAREKVPFIWVLHIGIFVVWLPAVIELKNNDAFKIYQLRDKKGWSQAELADNSSVSRVMIGKYERGEAVPSIDAAKKIADTLWILRPIVYHSFQSIVYQRFSAKFTSWNTWG